MKRLTKKKLGSSYPLKNDASAKIGLFTDYDGFYAFFEAVNRLGEIEDILGDDYDLDRLRELAQADRDGRCVVLPCKVVDTVFYLTGKPSLSANPVYERVENSVVSGFYWDNRGLQIRIRSFKGNHGTYGFYNETVFLTREVAEKALKGQS